MGNRKIYRAPTDLRYRDPEFIFGELKRLGPQLNLQWEFYDTCSVDQLEKEMDLIEDKLIKLTGDKHLSKLLKHILTLGILKSRSDTNN